MTSWLEYPQLSDFPPHSLQVCKLSWRFAMPRGSKPGERRGGRVKGTLNAATKIHRATIAAAADHGLTPLAYMLARLRDTEEDPKLRAYMATAAAPYVHPKLAAMELSGPSKGPIVIDANIDPGEAYVRLLGK